MSIDMSAEALSKLRQAECRGGTFIHTPGTRAESGIYALAISLASSAPKTIPRHLQWSSNAREKQYFNILESMLQTLVEQHWVPPLNHGDIIPETTLVEVLAMWNDTEKEKCGIWFERDYSFSDYLPVGVSKVIILRNTESGRWAVFSNFVKPLYVFETRHGAPSLAAISPKSKKEEVTAIDNLQSSINLFRGGTLALQSPIQYNLTSKRRLKQAMEMIRTAIETVDLVKNMLSSSLISVEVCLHQFEGSDPVDLGSTTLTMMSSRNDSGEGHGPATLWGIVI